MKKIFFFLFFVAIYSIAFSHEGSIPYTIQFKGAYGTAINSSKSFLYVNATSGNLRADGVLPASKNDTLYENYEWYFIPIEDEPGWYHVRNGNGAFLYNVDGDLINVRDSLNGAYTKWRFYKMISYINGEQEYSYRMVQDLGDKVCHMIRNTNTFITVSKSFTSNASIVLIKPSKDHIHFNKDIELITNTEPENVNSSKISLDPPFLVHSNDLKDIINKHYFPANFKRAENSNAILMYNKPKDNNSGFYYIQFHSKDIVMTYLSNLEEVCTHYKVNVRMRSSQILQSPAYLRFINENNYLQSVEHLLYVKEPNQWFDYQFYITLDSFSSHVPVEICASILKEEDYIDIDKIDIEKISEIPSGNSVFKIGEYDINGTPLYNYPFENPAYTYTVRISETNINEEKLIFIPAYFSQEPSLLQVSVLEINNEEIEITPLSNIQFDVRGIYLGIEEILIPGKKYKLMISVESDGSHFVQEVCVKIVPDKVFWSPCLQKADLSWNNDFNWIDEAGNPSFAPLDDTFVILEEGKEIYPFLMIPDLDLKKTPFIEYDYNYQLNTCANILFKNNTELGNPYFLDYKSAKVELEINTMQWYHISPPLKNMYSGDFIFEHLNPLSELQLYRIDNPQTGFYCFDWTQSFNNSNIKLNPGQGYNLRVGSLFYTEINETTGADNSSSSHIDKIRYEFPKNNKKFPFYDEITKLPSGKVEFIQENGRDYSDRFIYECLESGQLSVSESELLFELPIPVEEGSAPVIIGNPFMSHFDFESFYFYNHEWIYPEFKILNSRGDYTTVLCFDEDRDNWIDSYISTDNSINLYSIQPMQSFVIVTRDNYLGQPLIINKSMSRTRSIPDQKDIKIENYIAIRLESNDKIMSEAILYPEDNSRSMNRSSRRTIPQEKTDINQVFIISDDRYLDINNLTKNDNYIELGIQAPAKGAYKLIIDKLNSLPIENDLYLLDKEKNIQIPLNNKEKVIYHFENINESVINRFFIGKSLSSFPFLKNQTNVFISMDNGKIIIRTENKEPIESIVIYGIDGTILYEETGMQQSEVEILHCINENSVCIIKVNTISQTKIIKTLIK